MNLFHASTSHAPVVPPPLAAPTPEHARSEVLHAVDRAYRALVEQQGRQDVLRGLCQGLAEAMGLALVALVRRHDAGLLELEATSRENLLWAELMRLPERWDGTIAGHGPATRALRGGVPISLPTTDEGFLPWREAARRDGVAQVCAWPLETPQPEWVLLLFANSPRHADAQIAGGQGGLAAAACARLIAACDRLAQQRLLAAAVEHAGNAAFIADTEGHIAWCNAAFSRMSGYRSEEILGRNPRFLSSGRHGVRHYRELWSTLRSGQVWHGETVDRDSCGKPFTAMQTISPFGTGDRVTHYLAIYEDISRQKAEETQRGLCAGQDPLTGLMHRAALEQKLAEQLAQHRPVRIGLIAVGGLDRVAPLGDAAADAQIGELQSRIRTVMGADDAARTMLGEYLLRLPAEAEPARLKLAALHRAVSDPYPLIGEIRDLDLRIGQAVAPQDGATLDALLRHADRDLGVEPMLPARRGRKIN